MKIIITHLHYDLLKKYNNESFLIKNTQVLNEGPGLKGFLELLTTNAEMVKKALKDIKLTEFKTESGKFLKNTNEIIESIKKGQLSVKELGKIRKLLYNAPTSSTILKDIIALDVAKWVKNKHSDLKTDSEIIAFLRGKGFKDGNLILQKYNSLKPKVKSIIKPTINKSLLTDQQIDKLKNIFNLEQMKIIEKYFKHIISDAEKIAVVKNGKLYLKTSTGVEPASTIEEIIDMSLSGKINSGNIESFLSKIPEKLSNGNNFRNNMRNLLSGIVKNNEKNIKTPTIKQVKTLSNSSFKMAEPEESFKLAGWFDQKFYEAGDKRHSSITNAQFEKMLPETKEYLKKLYQRMKELFPGNINSRLQVKTERESIDAVTNNYWGGFGRQGKLVQDNYSNIKNTPSLPIPSKSVENDLNSIFPTSSNSQYGNGKNFWGSSN